MKNNIELLSDLIYLEYPEIILNHVSAQDSDKRAPVTISYELFLSHTDSTS